MSKVIVRTDRAGVFYGTLKKHENGTAILTDCRRIWQWYGAASLSQLAVEGTSKPQKCKFPPPVPRHTVLGVIEIIETTPKARESIEAVPVWRA
jgi:hypothetical protein